MTHEWVRRLIAAVRCPTPTADAFADTVNHRFPRWWGEGGEHSNALTRQWGEEPMIWCNPPFQLLPQVVEKAIKERANVLLICPNWRRRKW